MSQIGITMSQKESTPVWLCRCTGLFNCLRCPHGDGQCDKKTRGLVMVFNFNLGGLLMALCKQEAILS